MKSVTIKDVAREAGVSITTVSLVLAGKGNFSDETRKSILSIVKDMNYVPDWSGKKLRGGKTNVIALYVYSIRGYYSQLADAICGEIQKYGYELDIIVADHRDSIMQGLLGKRNDGAIILHHAIGDEDANILIENEIPVVFLDRKRTGKKASCVLLESYETGRKAAKYLYELGHRKILFVKGTDTFDAIERFRGFCDYMQEQGISLGECDCINGAFDRNRAYQSMTAFLDSGRPLPDAIFACNDDSAYGCFKALDEKGIRIPEDVSLLGCDDIELSRWYIPSLATISTNIDQQGICAARELIGLINGEQSKILTIPGNLIERASCISKINKSDDGNLEK